MSELGTKLDELSKRFSTSVAQAADDRALDAVRVAFLGRNGEITLLRRSIGQLPADERPTAGKTINDVVERLEADLETARSQLQMRSFDSALAQRVDVTFPAVEPQLGTIHPVRRIIEDVCDFFERRGFAVVLGLEVEPAYYNFDALNIPAGHPAREGFDSFFITDALLLRPHTSPMQIRTMQAHKPPIAVVAPGKCYRRDAVDARHLFQFHQVEGLLVAQGIHFGHLKWTLTQMCRELFGPDQQMRFRPSYFPFTEPSAEVDTTCPKCKGRGSCSLCGGSGWIELGGAGMVHPNVLREVGYDAEVVSGWAFGFGVERLGLALYEIDDIRRFVESDADFLHQLR
ncbi:MAG TPA: phenylalanine--tRNA ligase subunit alpha [Verrucomicrobiae bacterium]|nr:phenylalanine--tRNA ligase subunit alpha [Verrucomicrobiae bacterium]